MAITPRQFEALAYLLRWGAARHSTLADVAGGVREVNSLLREGYLSKSRTGNLGLSQTGRKAVTVGSVE